MPGGINKVVGLAMPATWSFDTMKRFSTLDTLEEEGALKNGETDGLGLYKFIEEKNNKNIADAKKNIKDYEKKLEDQSKDAERRANNGEKIQFQGLPERPQVADAEKLPENLSRYVTFLHPWMGSVLNQLVLMLMFFMLFMATLIILRLQDFV